MIKAADILIRMQTEVETEALPEESRPVKKVKIEEEPKYIAPAFLTPLVGAIISEGMKFTFECRYYYYKTQ